MGDPPTGEIDAYTGVGMVEAADGGVAQVRMERPLQCGRCRACGGRAGDGGMRVVEAEAFPGLEAGDRVEVAFDPRGVWRGTFWAFVLPLAALVGGALAGWHLRALQRALGLSADLTAALCGLALMAAAFGLGMLRNRRLAQSAACRPRILRRA